MTSSDPSHLERFLDAQSGVFEQACRELHEGRKQSHWMWFIFPQIKGLGASPTAIRYAISSLAEAEAYLKHPVLGPRLRHCTNLVLRVERRSIEQIFGYPDNLKFRSCMTLFSRATTENEIFNQALEKYFQGIPDQATIDRLAPARA
jgi:uncharacterized protein (DUF1810 family)